MSIVQAKQLWVSPEPETYYVLSTTSDGIADVIRVRIEGVGPEAKIFGQSATTRKVPVSEMIEFWVPVPHAPSQPPTWHERLMRDRGL